jgi:Zn-dependent peptidase ImmA (M78 family)/transcriptional regulator with XRE-family HTH domain
VSNAPQFSPARLRIARQLAGLKQVELAPLVEVTPPALSQYESGTHIPGAQVLQRLALALGVPREFFFAPVGGPAPTPAFFRSLRSTPQMERDRAAAFAWLVARLAAAVEAHVRLPRCDLRLADDLSNAPTREEIEAAAAAARDAWSIPAGPIANVVRLLEAHGAIVATFADGDRRLSAFSQWHGERPVVIFCLGKGDKARQRFDAAHELAHLALHAEPEPGNHVLEQQAEEFASAFLMPAADVLSYLPQGHVSWADLEEAKRVWGVSIQALLVRAHRLGTISDRVYQQAFRHLSRQGWRRNEPIELGPPEEPQLLARALTLMARKGLTAEHVFRTEAMPERYLPSLAGSATYDRGEAPVIGLPRQRPNGRTPDPAIA